MRVLAALALTIGLSQTAAAATKFQPLRKYDNDYSGNGLYPKGFAVTIRGNTATLTNLADKRKFSAKLDPSYKPRETRFKGYSMFRGKFTLERWNVEDREVLFKRNAISKNRAYVRYHGDQWGGVEIYVSKKK